MPREKRLEGRYLAARRSTVVETDACVSDVEPASDWLVCTCNASLGLAAAAAGTRCGSCRCCAGGAALATAPGGRPFSRRLCGENPPLPALPCHARVEFAARGAAGETPEWMQRDPRKTAPRAHLGLSASRRPPIVHFAPA